MATTEAKTSRRKPGRYRLDPRMVDGPAFEAWLAEEKLKRRGVMLRKAGVSDEVAAKVEALAALFEPWVDPRSIAPRYAPKPAVSIRAWLYRKVIGLSMPRTAEVLDCSDGWVRTSVKRGAELLRVTRERGRLGPFEAALREAFPEARLDDLLAE